ILERIVNVTLTLTSCNLALRGHREVLGQGNAGNLLSIIELLARYDPVLTKLINRPERSVKYLSHQIQDEIIYIMPQHVKAARINEINEALFYSIIIDTTQDMSKIDQLSQVYRNVTIRKNNREGAPCLNAIGKFSFIFLVNMQTKILECINAASQLLQAKDTDILKNAISVLMEFRKKFDEVKSATLALAAKWGSQTQFETTRARKEDSRLTETESNFRVHVLNTCLDIVIQQLSHRFTSLNRTVNIFEPVQPNTLLQAGDEELYQAAKWLSEHYRRDIAPSSPAQLLCRTSFRDQIAKQKSVVDLAKMLIVSHPAVTSTFTEVCAFLLFLTLPVSVASSERSFSKLKIIKNYL
uniref:Uncharacterized protein n=1 Tax=Poecilia formosa TaxID=48698 RepID=A0A087XID9_POEFO